MLQCSDLVLSKLYTLYRTERTNSIPCPVAHPRIGHIGDYSPAPDLPLEAPPISFYLRISCTFDVLLFVDCAGEHDPKAGCCSLYYHRLSPHGFISYTNGTVIRRRCKPEVKGFS